MSDKVYCKGCVFLKNLVGGKTLKDKIYECMHKDMPQPIKSSWYEGTPLLRNPEIINKDNNCKLFEDKRTAPYYSDHPQFRQDSNHANYKDK